MRLPLLETAPKKLEAPRTLMLVSFETARKKIEKKNLSVDVDLLFDFPSRTRLMKGRVFC